MNLAILSEIVKHEGYLARPVKSVRQARQAMAQMVPQLILLDICMPEAGGYEFCEELKADPRTREIPVIFISAMDSSENRKEGFRLGAVDFIMRPFDVDEVRLRVNTHLQNYMMQQELESSNRRLYKMVNDHLRRMSEEQKQMIFTLVKLYEKRDGTEEEHFTNVSFNARLLAQEMQFCPQYEKEITKSFLEEIELAAPLHDIGKITICDRILLKEGELTKEEREIIQNHTKTGSEILLELYSHNEYNHYLKMAAEIALYHHENWDGTGYPKKLAGEEIPLAARIVRAVDVYDVLLRKNPRREAFSQEEAMKVVKGEAGTSFEPGIIEILGKIQNQLRTTGESSKNG